MIPLVSKIKTEELSKVLAWKGPRLFFDNTPLGEAIDQFNQHNNLQVVIHDESLRELLIGGSFLVNDVDAFVRLLVGDSSIVMESPNERLVILKEAL